MRGACALVLAALLAAGGAAAQRPASGPPLDAPRALEADEVRRYVEALDGLVALDVGVGERLVVDPVAARRTGSGLAYEGAVGATLDAHGFDPPGFREVHWQVLAARAALAWDDRRRALDRGIEARERAGGELTPAEIERAVAAKQLPPALADVPPGNKTLVAPYRARLDRLLGR